MGRDDEPTLRELLYGLASAEVTGLAAQVKAHGVRFNPPLAQPPGRYQLRIGARESAGGAAGSGSSGHDGGR